MSASALNHSQDLRSGVVFALGAYGIWGLFPIYFKLLESIPADEVLMYRVVFSVAFLLLLVVVTGRLRQAREVLGNRKLILSLSLSALMMSGNWLLFIWAVSHHQILETSLAYFLNPLISIFLGMVLLSERLRAGQMLALVLAAGGVLAQFVMLGALPWAALGMAFSFGFYGLLRKRIAIESILGLFIETLLLLPVALLYWWWLASSGDVRLGADGWLDGVIMTSGIVTSIPLLLFASAARRLPLSMVGFLQYIAPSISFLLAVFVYGEQVESGKLITFVVIWIALLIFTLESIWQRRQIRMAT